MEIPLGLNHSICAEVTGPRSADTIIVLLNGSIFNYHQWDLLLAKGFLPQTTEANCYLRYDYGGIGYSTTAQRHWTIDSLVEELFAVLDRLEFERVHLYGLSKGTFIMQAAALQRPERIISIGGYGIFNACYSKLDQMTAVLSRRLENFRRLAKLSEEPLDYAGYADLWRNVYQEIVLQKNPAGFNVLDNLKSLYFREKLFPLMTPTPTQRMFDWFDYVLNGLNDYGRDLPAKLSGQPVPPALLQHAANDAMLPFAMAQELHDLWPGSTLLRYDSGYNHISPAFLKKQARRIAGDYLAWLKGLDA